MSIQTISFDVRIAGRIVPGVIDVACSSGFDQINSEATIGVLARPSWADERLAVTIWAKNSASGQGQIFSGDLVTFDWSYAPSKIGIVCQDLLARARDAWGGDDADYASQTSAAIVRNVLEKNAIPSSMARIEGDDWTVGVITPLVLKNGDDGYGGIIQPLDELEGYRTFSLSSGVIVRQRVTGGGGATATLTFAKGVTILSSPRHGRTALGIVNKVILTGVEYEGLIVGGPGVGEAQAPNPYVANVSRFTTERIQSNLIEDDATALLFAQRRVADKNRRPEYVEFSVPLDPRVQPGMTIAVNHPDLECSGLPMFCQHVAHSISASGATTTIRAIGGGLSGPVLQPPVANFAIQTVREGEDTGAGVTPLIVVVCDGSGSYDPDGTIASYAWTLTPTGGTASPVSGTGAVLRSVVSGATTAITVTLTVTDNDGLTGTLALTTPISLGTLPSEDLYLAFGSMSCSTDGEQTWRDVVPASGNATCLMPLAPAWGQLWGTTTGHLYATFDGLLTAPIDLGQPHGALACTAVWVHETDPTRLWAGFADGQVWRGALDITGQAATWTLAGTVPGGSIVELRESVGTLNELRATAGAGYYYSADGGATWALPHTFDVAWRMAAGFDTNLASGLNDAAPIYDEDAAPPTVPGGVTHLRGLSFGWRQPELYAANDAANLYLGAGPTFNLALHADTTPARVNHMIRSGNIDRVVYAAVGDGTGLNGFVKWIPDAKPPFFVRRTGTQAGLMIGFGALHAPAVRAALILLPYGETGAADKLWFYDPLTGLWTGKTPPEAGKRWYSCRASPFDPNKLLLLRKTRDGDGETTNNALWYSADFGATWSNIWTDLASGTNYDWRNGYAEWSSSVPDEWISARHNGSYYAIRGSGTSYTEHLLGTDGQASVMPGLAGEAFYGAFTTAGYLTAGNVPTAALTNIFAFGWGRTLRGTRQAAHVVLGLGIGSTLIHATIDYRSVPWHPISSSSGQHSLAVLTGGIVVVGNGTNIDVIANAWGSPSISQTSFGLADNISAAASDSQTQTVAAVLRNGANDGGSSIAQPAIRDSASGAWTLLARPPLAGLLANAIEVVQQ